MRRFVIGDIHGCGKALRTVLEAIDPRSDDEIVFLGDYIDRGPNSRDVVDQLIELGKHCRTVTLRGNHEIMLRGVVLQARDDTMWLANGGQATVASYGGSVSKIPDAHMEFFQNLRPFYEVMDSIFVHACYDPTLPMFRQPEKLLYWTHLPHPVPEPHLSGKRVFVGHTPQPHRTVADFGHLVCVDTYCFGGGVLTAMEVETGAQIQVDRHGHLQRAPIAALADLARKAVQVGGRQLSRMVSRKNSDDRQALQSHNQRKASS